MLQVPYEYVEQVPQEREVIKEEQVERRIPQVKSMYPYKGQGMEIAKGEVGTFIRFSALH